MIELTLDKGTTAYLSCFDITAIEAETDHSCTVWIRLGRQYSVPRPASEIAALWHERLQVARGWR